MNGRRARKLALWVLAIIQIAAIFFMSAQDGGTSAQTSARVAAVVARVVTPDYEALSAAQRQDVVNGLQHVTRKAAHFVEFALLSALITLALRGRARGALFAVLACLLVAALDEWSQTGVGGRSGQLADVLLDAAGGVTGALCAWVTACAYRAIRRKKKGRTL